MPKISIIVPIYNSEAFLKKSIDSIQVQTLQDIEIICVDDASSDCSVKILEDLQKNDERIKIIKLETNKGQGHARNVGMKSANGDYVGFVDSDDWVDANYFERLYQTAIEKNADIASAKIMYVFGEVKKYGSWPKAAKIFADTLVSDEEKLRAIYTNCNTAAYKHIFRKEFLQSNQIEFAQGVLHEDQFFVVKAFLSANKIISEKFDSPNYYYNVRLGSSMNSEKTTPAYKKALFDQVKVFSEILNFLEEQNMDEKIISDMKKDFEFVVLEKIEEVDVKFINQYVNFVLSLLDEKEFTKKIRAVQIIKNLRIEKNLQKLRKRFNIVKSIVRAWN